MNQKKAKAARLVVKQLVRKGVITATKTTYRNDRRGFRHVDPDCSRGVYRRMKRIGIARVLAGE